MRFLEKCILNGEVAYSQFPGILAKEIDFFAPDEGGETFCFKKGNFDNSQHYFLSPQLFLY